MILLDLQRFFLENAKDSFPRLTNKERAYYNIDTAMQKIILAKKISGGIYDY